MSQIKVVNGLNDEDVTLLDYPEDGPSLDPKVIRRLIASRITAEKPDQPWVPPSKIELCIGDVVLVDDFEYSTEEWSTRCKTQPVKWVYSMQNPHAKMNPDEAEKFLREEISIELKEVLPFFDLATNNFSGHLFPAPVQAHID